MIASIWWEFTNKVRQRGVLETLRNAWGLLTRPASTGSDDFDRKYGTDTARKVPIFALGIAKADTEHAYRYQAAPTESFFRDMEFLGEKVRGRVFVDLGAGKGVTVMMASLYPFSKIVGVEISPRLVETARRNLGIFKDRKQVCTETEIVCHDAGTFEFPDSELLIYLYNPFDEKIMGEVVRNLERHAKHVLVVYRHATARSVWDASPAFKVLADADGMVAYESLI